MFRFLGISFFYYLFILFLLRVGFYFAFNVESHAFEDILKSFYIGAKFDFKIVIITILPYVIYSFSPIKIRVSLYEKICFIFSTLLFILFINLYYVDFGHYAYLKTRVTAPSIVDNIANPMIAIRMMWQSYPIIWIILSFITICYISQLIFKKLIFNRLSFRFTSNKKASIARTILFFIIAILVYGKISFYPLRWSEAYFSKNKFISQLTLNPFLSFSETYRHRNLKYDKDKLTKSYQRVAKYLNVKKTSIKNFNFQRNFNEGQSSFENANVIVILMESMASDKTSMSNNPLDPTPRLAEIAKEGVYFSQFFTPTEATARGVFATLTSIPDVVNKKSSSRNPRFVDHVTVMDQFKGYERYYFLGGSASWANIRSLISSNIKGVKIREEGSYDAPRVDVWGISDLSLFLAAHETFMKTKKPFVAMIQSAGFHRPYTIPGDSRGFKIGTPHSLKKIQSYGFDSIEQYNSMRFQDHALGEFFKELRSSEYGKNTIVAIMGDHGLPSNNSQHVASGYYKHRLVNHHVPLVIHYPKKVKPRVDNTTFGSQVDVFPTVADILGMPFKIKSLGRSLIKKRNVEDNKSFIFSWHRNPRLIGLIDEQFYYEDAPDYQKLFKYKSDSPLKDYSKEYPDKFLELQKLTRGMYEASLYLLENNKKE